MLGNRKRNTVIGVVCIVIGVVAFSAIFAFASYRYKNTPQNFYDNRRGSAEKLYDEVTAHDLDGGYPGTAEEVVNLNNKIVQLYYGKMVKNEEILTELVDIQRKLFADELLDKNPRENQVETLLEAIDELYSQNVYVYKIEQGITYYSSNVNMCIVPVTQTLINYENVYWNYFLRQDADGRWKIYTYMRADENFRTLEE